MPVSVSMSAPTSVHTILRRGSGRCLAQDLLILHVNLFGSPAPGCIPRKLAHHHDVESDAMSPIVSRDPDVVEESFLPPGWESLRLRAAARIRPLCIVESAREELIWTPPRSGNVCQLGMSSLE